jgi:hypothetical protein
VCSPPREAQVSGQRHGHALARSQPLFPKPRGVNGAVRSPVAVRSCAASRRGRDETASRFPRTRFERPKATGASPSLPIPHGGKNELAARFQNPKDFAERERDDVRCQFARNPDHGLDRRGRSLEVEQGTIICGTELTICAAALDGCFHSAVWGTPAGGGRVRAWPAPSAGFALAIAGCNTRLFSKRSEP